MDMVCNKAQEQKWQAQDDARVMAQYQEIIGDKARMGRAIKVAKEQVNDLQKRVSIMNKVAGGGAIKRKKK